MTHTKLVISHRHTDFDALAAMLGARLLWPEFEPVKSSSVAPSVREYLALHKDWLRLTSVHRIDASSVEEAIVVDTRDRDRLSEFADHLQSARRITVFDHHPPGPRDIAGDEVVVEPVGACVTLLCEKMERRGMALTPQQATLLMLGLYADTGNLAFPTTTARDLKAAAYLRSQKASLPVVNRYLSREYSPEQQHLLVALMDQMDVVERRGLRFGVAACETPEYIKGGAEVVERLMELMGLDGCMGVLTVRGREAVQLIGRSATRHLDVSRLASRFGGGGHPSAAAARTSAISKQELVEKIREHLQSLEIAAMTVGDAMSTPVQVVEADTPLEELVDRLDDWNVSGVPVCRNGALDGMVSQRDVQRAVDREDWEVPVAGFMTRPVVTASVDESLQEALERMTAEDIGRLPVVDDSKVVGIISRSDILASLYEDEEEGLRSGRSAP